MINNTKWREIFLFVVVISFSGVFTSSFSNQSYAQDSSNGIYSSFVRPILDSISIPSTSSDVKYKAKVDRINSIVEKLIKCESRGNPRAYNKNDLDNTPSYGILQFKPGTLYSFGMEFKLLPSDFPENEILNRMDEPDLQIAVAKKMIEKYGMGANAKKFWKQQFPSCSKQQGLW